MKKVKIILILFGFIGLKAQTVYEKGYLVNEKGDTLVGEIKINQKKEFEIYTKVGFRDEKGMQKNYKPEKVNAFGFKDRVFVKMEYGSDWMYYEVLSRGDISFYKLVFEGLYKTKKLETEYFVWKTGSKKLQDLKTSKFKKSMMDLMEDHLDSINEYEEPEDKQFDEVKAAQVISNYNAWKANQN